LRGEPVLTPELKILLLNACKSLLVVSMLMRLCTIEAALLNADTTKDVQVASLAWEQPKQDVSSD
jgi:hypothetical protein